MSYILLLISLCCCLIPSLPFSAAGQEDGLLLDGPDDQAVEDDQDGEGDDVDYHRDCGGHLKHVKYVRSSFYFHYSHNPLLPFQLNSPVQNK